MSNTKNEVLELAQRLDDGFTGLKVDLKPAAAMLRSQAAEIEQLKEELQRVYTVVTSHAEITFKAEDERDQLKAKNEKLVDALSRSEYELQVAEEVLYQRAVKAANDMSAEVAGSTLVINSLKQSLEEQQVGVVQEFDLVYVARLIEALYENSDPVSVEAAEEFQRMLDTATTRKSK